jgi:DNA-binding response OmpR family regulator
LHVAGLQVAVVIDVRELEWALELNRFHLALIDADHASDVARAAQRRLSHDGVSTALVAMTDRYRGSALEELRDVGFDDVLGLPATTADLLAICSRHRRATQRVGSATNRNPPWVPTNSGGERPT